MFAFACTTWACSHYWHSIHGVHKLFAILKAGFMILLDQKLSQIHKNCSKCKKLSQTLRFSRSSQSATLISRQVEDCNDKQEDVDQRLLGRNLNFVNYIFTIWGSLGTLGCYAHIVVLWELLTVQHGGPGEAVCLHATLASRAHFLAERSARINGP